MARKTKKKAQKTKEVNKETKDDKFNFNEEIIIGLKKIENDNETENKKANKKKKKLSKKENKVKQKEKNIKKTQSNESKKLTKKQEIKKQKSKAIFKLIKWTTLLGIIIGGSIAMLLSPIFNIRTIEVIGNKVVSADEVISLSKIEIGTNMFKYREKDIAENIKENAYFENIKIRRKLPDTIEIITEERKASFLIEIGNAHAFINNQGYILEISDRSEKLPIVTGIATEQEEIHEGNRICKEDLKKLNDVLKIIESAASNDLYNSINKIDISDKNDYILTLEKENKIVHLGDISNLSTKMLWIITFNETEKDNKGEIMLNINLNDGKSKPYFRKEV